MSGLLLVYDISSVPQRERRQLVRRVTETLRRHPGLKRHKGWLSDSAVCYIRRPSKLVAGYDIVYGAIHELGGHAGNGSYIPARHPIRRSVLRYLQPYGPIKTPTKEFI